jgi:hypothetical protein
MKRGLLITCFLAAACGGNGGGGDDMGDDGGDDAPECTSEGSTQCSGNTFETCVDGQWDVTEQCNAICDDELGCIVCQPDTVYCDGDDVMACNSGGTGGTVQETCTGGEHCLGGGCVDLCAEADEANSYIGCEYYAIDLDNAIEVLDHPFPGLEDLFPCDQVYPGALQTQSIPVCWEAGGDSAGSCDTGATPCPTGYTCQNPTSPVCVLDAQHSPYAVVVSNPQSFAVDVVVSSMATGTLVSQTVTVNAGAVQAIFPQQLGFGDQSVDHSDQVFGAYRLQADAPIVAYQFNPLDNVDVFSNDGSLLIPTTTWDAEYYVMSYPTLTRRPDGTNDYNGYLSVVASVDDTVVEVTPSAGTRASADGTVAAIAAGATATFTLDAYEVLNLEAIGGATGGHTGGDLTGSLVRSTDPARPIGVFGGHEAIVVAQAASPNPQYSQGPCCADHAEEMMFPNATWGELFAVARSQQRNGEPDNLRIMAQRAGTAVTFEPAVQSTVSGNCAALGAGEFCEVKINGDTVVTSNEPILVGHFLESVIWQNPISGQSNGSGDPSMALAVPTEQFRGEYTILVPMQYESNYAAIATSATGSVRIDGNDVTGQLAVFGGDYRGGRIAITSGQHTISCSAGCGIEIMGYSDAVSYLFAGGLDLNTIVVP